MNRTGGVTGVVALLLLALCCAGCAGAQKRPPSELESLRDAGARSNDAEVVGRLLLAELLSPGGRADRAKAARARLDRIGRGGMLAHLARGLDDAVHGRLTTTSDHYLHAAREARVSPQPIAPLIAWFSINQATAYRFDGDRLYERWAPFVKTALAEPRALGWRARADLVDWWSDEAYDRAATDSADETARRFGCLREVRLAGPFGHGASVDVVRSFPPEAPGPWPSRWPVDPDRHEAPRVLKTDRFGCSIVADEAVGDGVFYAETYLTVPSDRDVLVVVGGGHAIWVDDAPVHRRDIRVWGSWLDFGVVVELVAGRHRIVARLDDPSTAVRVLNPTGTPARLKSSTDAAPGYTLFAPRLAQNPNLLTRWVRAGRAAAPSGDLERFLAASLAYAEGEGDVASVLIEPLIKDTEKATGPALALAADFARADPLFDESQTKDLTRLLYERAIVKDPELWEAALELALWEAERSGTAAAVRPVAALVERFEHVPQVHLALAQLYGRLGWTAEYGRTVSAVVQRFENHPEALYAAVALFEQRGDHERAEKLVERIVELDPDSEIVLTRALARQDYASARAELERLGRRRPERKDIKERVYDVMVRAGNKGETENKLLSAIKQDPTDAAARLALADSRFAKGNPNALTQALVDAVENGAPTEPFEDALDLVESMSELEPYRVDGLQVIREYEARAEHLAGNAARVLDYAVVWVHEDGSSRMLEHEIVRIQSAEAQKQFAESGRLDGLVLKVRVVKADGRLLEPEQVAGKPTITMPHLEVGDYVETEQIISRSGDGEAGLTYLGPNWFFREENVAYARSEFSVISPRHKGLVVETRNNVPTPTVQDLGPLLLRSWRADFSPAAPSEPNSAPASEFLPSVWIGWGITPARRLRDLADALTDLTPVDPRIAKIAGRIVEDAPPNDTAERARRLYRWVVSNVEDGEERDGRRVVVSKRGDRWRAFRTLCAALGLPIDFAMTKSRLAHPPHGPISEALQYNQPLMRLKVGNEPLWITINNKYTPFGHVPAELRDMPAYVFTPTRIETTRTAAGGLDDRIAFRGKVDLAADGSARFDLVQSYEGKYAMALREAFAELPEQQLRDVIESRLLGQSLRGARLVKYRFERFDELDAPLELHLQAQVPHFARRKDGTLIVSPPFTPSLGRLAGLPSRQTPLLLGDTTRQDVTLQIQLPKHARVVNAPRRRTLKNADRKVEVADRVEGDRLVLERSLTLPAGRIQPASYADFAEFARQADELLSRNLSVELGAGN